MPSAGAVCPPQIIPLRRHVPGIVKTAIDTTTLIELITDTPECKIYFTSDGTKPSAFQRKIGGKEVTFKYVGPFTLKPGKRILKAIAVARDGMRESDVVTKQFMVEDIGAPPRDSTTDYTTDDYTSFFETSDLDTDNTLRSRSSLGSSQKAKKSTLKKKPQRSKSPTRKPNLVKTPKEAWASSSSPILDMGAYDGPASAAEIPDGPFNPVNYSGTQINVWGAPPSAQWPGMNANSGAVTFGLPNQGMSPYSTQFGYLTENMIQNCNPDNRHVTVGELRKSMEKRPQIKEQPRTPSPPPPKPAIEYPPKDPVPKTVSPGNGDFKENILHVYAHMLEFAKGNKDFRLKVAEPKMGKMLEANFEDGGDGYRISVVMAKPGVPSK